MRGRSSWLRWVLLALLCSPLPAAGPMTSTALADDRDNDRDDDDDDREKDRADDRAPRLARPVPPPPSLSALSRSLHVKRLWVERSGQLPVLRAGIERGGVLVGTLTLHHTTLEPLPYAGAVWGRRANSRPSQRCSRPFSASAARAAAA